VAVAPGCVATGVSAGVLVAVGGKSVAVEVAVAVAGRRVAVAVDATVAVGEGAVVPVTVTVGEGAVVPVAVTVGEGVDVPVAVAAGEGVVVAAPPVTPSVSTGSVDPARAPVTPAAACDRAMPSSDARTAAGDAPGLAARISATAPATCGAAMLVPLR